MRLRPKYSRAKEEGRQRSGSLISTFLMRCCRPRELVSAASGDEFYRVLKTLHESTHRFLHQPLALDAEHVILVHKFLDDDASPLQQGTGHLLLVCTSDDLRPQQVALSPEPLIALPPATSPSQRSDPSGYGRSHACACNSCNTLRIMLQ